VVLGSGHVLIAGGYGRPEMYVPGRSVWRPVLDTAFRSHPVMVKLRNGSILLTSGLGAHDHDLRSTRVYSSATGKWAVAGSLRTARSQAVGVLLPSGEVLVSGGEQVSVRVLRSAEVFNPARRIWTQTAPMRTARDAAIAGTLSDGTVLVCGE
jgi:hypothetical protein